MNGRMTKSERDRTVSEFIKKCRPYESREVPKFDMRGYARFLKENGIDRLNVGQEIMARFAL